jgi:hypothetical protein
VAPTRQTTGPVEDDVEEAKRERNRRGLRADDSYVRALEADPALSASREEWGMALTPLDVLPADLLNA